MRWPEGTIVAGQQFEYGYDDIGNRRFAASGGDQWGANLRYENYSANNLNQYTQRTVPKTLDVMGSATNTATVSVNDVATYRKSDYYRAQLTNDNSSAARFLSITNLAVLNNGTNADITTNITGNLFVPKTPEVYAHDADGNLTNDGRWIMTWDAENRLTSLKSLPNAPVGSTNVLLFAYDYQSRRISKVVSNFTEGSWSNATTARFAYDGWNLIAQVSATNALVQSYCWGTDLSGQAGPALNMQGAGGVGGLLALNDSSLGTHFVSYDGNGNVAALAKASDGTTSGNYEYLAFGQTIRMTGAAAEANPFRFSTKFEDEESGWLYYGYRYLGEGRWLSKDPIEEGDGPTLYVLVGNDPVRHIDAFGLERLTLTYDFAIETPWWERINQPRGTVWTQDLDAILKNIRQRVGKFGPTGKDDCNCVEKLTLTGHSGVPGFLQIGAGEIDPGNVEIINNSLSALRRNVAQEDLRREVEFLQRAGSYLCRDSTVDFVQCSSGAGPQGGELLKFLKNILPPGTAVVLYRTDVTWKWGTPVCTKTSKSKKR